ncbi:MAG: hypothetical protein ACRCXX_14135 [Cetobacterium sp.]|uniref:hypothetical protein n=1 Tax=Cetobacterium sp. TaxID=2071632 RepID=UPI003F3CF493
MKKIRLKTIHYINWKGITLTSKNPSVDATEENLEKLNAFIKVGKLEVVDLEENKRKDIENPQVIEKPMLVGEQIVASSDQPIVTTVERIKVYTSEELKAMNKAELLAICEERKIEVKKNLSVAKIEEAILKNQ